MTIESRTFEGTSGTTIIDIPELAYVGILRVCRNGLGFNVSLTSTGNRKVKFTPALGRLEFVDPFEAPPSVGVVAGEKIYVRYKY